MKVENREVFVARDGTPWLLKEDCMKYERELRQQSTLDAVMADYKNRCHFHGITAENVVNWFFTYYKIERK